MGKVGRFACIFTPMVFTICSLGLLIAVGLGGTNQNNAGLNRLWFFRANTSDFHIDTTINGLPKELTDLLNSTNSPAVNTADVKDFYHISLWNYCSGDFGNNNTANASNANDHVTFCSPRKSNFWFNPVEIWGLNATVASTMFGNQLNNGLKAYQTVTKWMTIAYIVATVATAVEILVGFLALFSRWGSLTTTIVSFVSSTFLIGFALTATILFATLTGTFNTALKIYNIHASVGHDIFVLIWLSVAFSWAAGIFWLFSSCCCSGRADKIKGYNEKASKPGQKPALYEYERVESPYMGHSGSGPAPAYNSNVQMGDMGKKNTAYEPFRHGDV